MVPSQALSTNTFQCFVVFPKNYWGDQFKKIELNNRNTQNPNMGFKVCPKFHPNFESGLRSSKIEI